MCRIFAFRASHVTRVHGSLLTTPTSLAHQSCCDLRGECHGEGWGIGYFAGDRPCRTRSVRPADQDPEYQALAGSVAATAVLAHVRRSSMGSVAERNSHPFLYRRWLFAHNGTLFGFPEVRERVRGLIPPELRQALAGDTDSEHAFFVLLGRLQEMGASLEGPVDAEVVCQALADTLHILKDLCPGKPDEESQLNFVLTDGQVLAAARWGYTLYRLERRGDNPANPDQPVTRNLDYHALAVASEPTTTEAWEALPERSILCIRPNLTWKTIQLGS